MKKKQVTKQPIIVLGAPRSGTTILSDVLGQHRDVAHLIEPRMVWRYGNDRKSDMLKPEDATPKVMNHIRGKFSEYLQKSGKKHLVEKTPSNSVRPHFVNKVFPDAKYIHIIRNGYDACLATDNFWDLHSTGISNVADGRLRQRLSELNIWRMPYYIPEFIRRIAPSPLAKLLGPNLWGPRLPGMPSLLKELGPLAVSCLQWRTCVELSCQFGRTLPSDRYFEIRLEDFSAQSIRQLISFCDFSEDQSIYEYIENTFDNDRAGARTKAVTKKQVESVSRWIEPTINWLGYSAPTPTDD